MQKGIKIGIIARCDHTGLGIQSKEFFDHIPCKALVVDMSNVKGGHSHLKQHHEWYPDQTIVKIDSNNKIPEATILNFIEGLDILFIFETPYDYNVFYWCREKGVKTILQLNYEFLEYPNASLYPPDLFAAPSMWHYKDIPEPKIFLQVPVSAEKFVSVKKERTFVHLAGNISHRDRNGTYLLLRCLRYIKKNVRIVIRSPRQLVEDLLPRDIPANIRLEYDICEKENYWENYDGGVMVIPRKYGGLCLIRNEALAAGMPVIMSNTSPNYDRLPKEWLVHSLHKGDFLSKQKIDVWETELDMLAMKIDEFCDPEFYNKAVSVAEVLGKEISWEHCLSHYYDVFNNLLE